MLKPLTTTLTLLTLGLNPPAATTGATETTTTTTGTITTGTDTSATGTITTRSSTTRTGATRTGTTETGEAETVTTGATGIRTTATRTTGRAAQAWTPCPNDKIGMECTDLQVPVDWRKPDGRKITLKLGRLKATGPGPSKGSVLLAYGGPGAPGIALTQTAAANWWTDLRKRMDIVTWDTRGYGEQHQGLSTGLQCAWTRIPIPDSPADDADFGRLSDTNRGYAEACRLKDPELFANMSSADQARDMEAIRKALGDDKLNFYGASYAGFYGQSYARLFPGNVRTMVLDGTWSHSAPDWTTELVEMAKSNEQHMQRFFTWCATNDCRDIPALWRKVIARAARTPIPTKTPNVAYRTRDLQSFALFLARQGPSAWPKLAEAIRKSADGDASDFVPARGARYPDQTTGVTECTDWPRFATRKEQIATTKRVLQAAPNTGTANTLASGTLSCIGWPVPVTNPPAPLPKGLPPLLGAGAWGESDAVDRVLSQVPGSTTIHHDGPGHTLYGTNPCARTHINRYFTNATLPPKKTAC
ncbi:alpha/beta fold hydrolase [Nonomuraea jiangxiensis]|uniref:TAP-like protein n=1 Tax=Nonomuraea jiangxiensis TaxID=633440 RepID=A0A1G8NGM2_9ACTN|nr:alpha/beta fold hydrolase [Nonomuraea jiangxiensis]SDI79292.1 TAP-like protein [Nonomuraea jiangxiensis]